MSRIIAGFVLFLAALLLPLAPAAAEPDRPAPPWPAICEEEPDLREIYISTPTSEAIPLIDIPDGYFGVPTLTEGEFSGRIINITNTSKTTMLIKVNIVGIDVPEFFTSEPTPVSFKVGLSPWVVSPKTDDSIDFELQLLEPGQTREVQIGTRMGATDELIMKEEGFEALYRLDIGAEANCRLLSDPLYPDELEDDDTDQSGGGSQPNIPVEESTSGSDVHGPGSEAGIGAESGPGTESGPAGAGNTAASDELVWTGADVRELGLLAGALLVIGAILKRRRHRH